VKRQGEAVPAKRAGSRKTVNSANLVALGAERLAEILLGAGEDDPDLKRRLRMELAGEVGPEHLAAEIGKRLTATETRRSRVHWRRYKAFVRDLELQRAMIARLAGEDAKLALDLLLRFFALAGEVFRLVDDGRGEVEGVFRAAVAEAGAVIAGAKPSAEPLADQIVALIEADDELVLEDLAPQALSALDPDGIAALRDRLEAAVAARSRPAPRLRRALQAAADAQGDVEGFVAALAPGEAKQPAGGAEIARRLLAAGRTEDALAALARSAPPPSGRTLLTGVKAWEDAYLAALDADGQTALAQEVRWSAFERRLAADRLRAFLKRLPDFDDVEAEDRAMAHARAFPSFNEALRFMVEWPAGALAAELILARADEIEGGQDTLLEAAAELVIGRHPLAATLVLRALVQDVLRWGRADRYRDAQRWLAEIDSLAGQVGEWEPFEPHEAFLARMARMRRL
jgi:hypothetical protein